MVLKKKSLALMVTLLFWLSSGSLSMVAHAKTSDDVIITPYYTLISSIHGTCTIDNGKIALAGTVNTAGKATSAKVTVLLQKNAGGGWKDVKTFSQTGTSKATVMDTYTPESGVFYRAKITGEVSNSSDNESVTITTTAVGL